MRRSTNRMARWTTRRPWPVGRRRGVSDMLAVILAVAITVALAAILYVLISSLTHSSSGAAPLGSEFAWGSPYNDTSTPSNGCGSTAHYCYHIEMVATASSVNLAQMTLALRTPMGLTAGWPTSVTAVGGSITVVSPVTGTAVATYWPLNTTWQIVKPFNGIIGSGFVLLINCGGAAEGANQGLWGLALVAIGTNGYSGIVISQQFT